LITIAATFTADPVIPYLRWLTELAGIDRPVGLAPYGQIFQELLDPTSHSARHAAQGGATAVLLRLDDLVREQPAERQNLEQLQPLADELAQALAAFARGSKGPVWLVLLPSALPGADAMARGLASTVQTQAGVHWIADDALRAVVDLNAQCDRESDRLGHIPYTDVGYAGLALALTRALHAVLVPAHKVLVLDCDNTIWDGVVGEDGIDGIQLSPPFLAVQRFAIEAQRRGTLVCLASKNGEADVQAVLDQRGDMLLRPEHIVAQRVNWLPKPQNLASLAAELNLGLDAFVFLDDNPVECGQMKVALPQVVTLQLPEPSQIASFLAHLWVFDKSAVTDEDVRRTAMYRENQARQQLESSVADIGAFIASLAMEVDLAPPDESEWPRVAQLTHRTNQFNFTTRRRSEAEMRAFAAVDGQQVLRVRVRDRFGDHGLVGVMLSAVSGGVCSVDTFLLSCRVLGRGVEHAMLRHLASQAVSQNSSVLQLTLLTTAKNEPARAFADSVAQPWRRQGDDGAIHYDIPVADGQAIQHRPGEDPEAVLAAAKGGDKPAAKAISQDVAGRWQRYERLAVELTNAVAVDTAWRASQTHARDLPQAVVPPASQDERRLLALWEPLFNTSGLGVEDDYAALGGTSLMAARLFADIEREFGQRLRLTTILEAPTVRQLALRLRAQPSAAGGSNLITLREGKRGRLFLVHDGDGETLLYRNLAQRLPEGIAVVGIEPTAQSGIPMASAAIESMAADYVTQLRTVQPHGPYHLGGMCAGGLIAYEMAQQLSRMGEPVQQVLMMDAATPQATPRPGRLAAERAERLRRLQLEVNQRFGANPLKYAYLAWRWVGKAVNTVRWNVQTRMDKAWVSWRLGVLRKSLSAGRAWPRWLPPLTVRQIYNAAESGYRPNQALSPQALILVRATQGQGADIPYREVYAESALGWQIVAPQLSVVDVPGGHASMLQEPWVASLADIVNARLSSPAASNEARS